MNVISPVVNTSNIVLADFVRVTTLVAGVTTVYRFATSPYSITVPAVDSEPFSGLGALVKIGDVQRDIKSTANETTVTLVGLDTSLLGWVLGQNIKGSKIEMWHGFFDTTNNLINNQFLYSQQLSNSVWIKENAISITDNYALAPDNTTTATRVIFPTGFLPRIYQNNIFSLSASTDVTFFLWAKSNTGTNQTLQMFLRQTGFGTVYAQQFYTVTTEWQKFKITGTIPAGASVMSMLYQSTSTNPTNDILIWGMQIEQGVLSIDNNISSYVATTSTAQSGLYKFFTGYINAFTISEQWMEEIRQFVGTIGVSASSIQIILQNRTAGRYTNDSAWQFFNVGDTSMNRVGFIQTINYQFGKDALPNS